MRKSKAYLEVAQRAAFITEREKTPSWRRSEVVVNPSRDEGGLSSERERVCPVKSLFQIEGEEFEEESQIGAREKF